MTLAEIMVCLAVVAIAITMVVSFAMLMSERTKASRARLETQQDLTLIETVAENWLDRMSGLNASFSLSDNRKSVTAAVTETVEGVETEATYTLGFSYGSFTGTLPGGETISVPTEQIEGVVFSLEGNGSDVLFFCTVTTAEDEITFAINPRIGEIVGG